MGTSPVTYLGTKYYHGTWSTSFVTTQDSAYIGVNGSNKYDVCFKVQLPAFDGVSDSISFTFPYIYGGPGYNSTVYLYAAVTTVESPSIYGGKSGILSDPNAIVINQSITVPNCTAQLSDPPLTITFSSTQFSSGGTYYIYLYGSDEVADLNVCQLYDFHSNANHYDASFSLTYQSGLVYIDNGSGWDAYQVYIDNGSGWDLYIPYVDNGSGWDIPA